MPTKILDATKEADILEAVSILRAGGLVALPTETVYGLAADALSASAVAKIFVAKKRPESNPLIWHVHDQEAAKRLFNEQAFSDTTKKRFELLANSFWPGPLTMVATKSNIVSNQLNTVAVRIPRSPATLKILKLINGPLVMPSANISSRPSSTCSRHVLKTLKGRIDAVVDAGACEVGIESTVIRIDQAEINILRPGHISDWELARALAEPVSFESKKSSHALESPGLAFRHYAPQVAKIVPITSGELSVYWRTSATIIGRSKDLEGHNIYERPSRQDLTLVLPDAPEQFGQNLYAVLYKAEERPKENLVLVMPTFEEGENSREWTAILDRLRRSAAS